MVWTVDWSICAFTDVTSEMLNDTVDCSFDNSSVKMVVSDQVRLIMKAHAFVRENIPRAMQHVKKRGL